MGGIGGTIGGILGAAAGTFVAPGLGTTAGASLGTGIGQLIEGKGQKKKAQGMAPSPVDVGRQKLLQDLLRQQKKISTGTTSASKDALQLAKTLQRGSFAAGGYSPNMYTRTLAETMKNIQDAEANQMLNLNTQIGQSVGEIEKRKFDLTSLAQTKLEADSALNLKDSGQNLGAALMPKGKFTNPFDIPNKKKKKLGEVDETEKTQEEGLG
jgi:hypothetical protein